MDDLIHGYRMLFCLDNVFTLVVAISRVMCNHPVFHHEPVVNSPDKLLLRTIPEIQLLYNQTKKTNN